MKMNSASGPSGTGCGSASGHQTHQRSRRSAKPYGICKLPLILFSDLEPILVNGTRFSWFGLLILGLQSMMNASVSALVLIRHEKAPRRRSWYGRYSIGDMIQIVQVQIEICTHLDGTREQSRVWPCRPPAWRGKSLIGVQCK